MWWHCRRSRVAAPRATANVFAQVAAAIFIVIAVRIGLLAYRGCFLMAHGCRSAMHRRPRDEIFHVRGNRHDAKHKIRASMARVVEYHPRACLRSACRHIVAEPSRNCNPARPFEMLELTVPRARIHRRPSRSFDPANDLADFHGSFIASSVALIVRVRRGVKGVSPRKRASPCPRPPDLQSGRLYMQARVRAGLRNTVWCDAYMSWFITES